VQRRFHAQAIPCFGVVLGVAREMSDGVGSFELANRDEGEGDSQAEG